MFHAAQGGERLANGLSGVDIPEVGNPASQHPTQDVHKLT